MQTLNPKPYTSICMSTLQVWFGLSLKFQRPRWLGLKVGGLGFRVLGLYGFRGFRILGLGFRGLGFGAFKSRTQAAAGDVKGDYGPSVPCTIHWRF